MRAKERSPEYFVCIITYYHCILLFICISVNFSSKYILRAVRISSFIFAPASATYKSPLLREAHSEEIKNLKKKPTNLQTNKPARATACQHDHQVRYRIHCTFPLDPTFCLLQRSGLDHNLLQKHSLISTITR